MAPPVGKLAQHPGITPLKWYVEWIPDFHGTPQTSLKKILTSDDLWDFSLFLSKFGEWKSEAFFAFQPESCLFSFALWKAKEAAGESWGRRGRQ